MSDEEIRKIFGKNLTRILAERGKTQADLYKYMHVSSATASNWCNGVKVPRLDKIQSLCNWLMVEKSDLLEKKDKIQSEQIYYYNKDSAEAAQFLFDNPEYKVLFDAARNVKPEDIQYVADLITRMSK